MTLLTVAGSLLEGMFTREIEKGISDLVSSLPAKMKPVIEKACKENLRAYPQPLRSTYKIDGHPHSYGPNATRICEGSHVQLVFGEMKKDGRCSAPTTDGSRVETGKTELLLPLDDMIVRYVDEEERAIYNITLPKHVFFPGYVKLKVVERHGATFVDVSGKGNGNWKKENTAMGPTLFAAILKTHLVPKVHHRLNKSMIYWLAEGVERTIEEKKWW